MSNTFNICKSFYKMNFDNNIKIWIHLSSSLQFHFRQFLIGICSRIFSSILISFFVANFVFHSEFQLFHRFVFSSKFCTQCSRQLLRQNSFLFLHTLFCFKCLLKLLIVEGVDFNSFKMKMKTAVESNFSFVVWSKLWEHFFC